MRYLILSLCCLIVGCSGFDGSDDVTPLDYGIFKKSEYSVAVSQAQNDKPVTIRLDGLTVNQAMLLLTDATGQPIVWSDKLDGKKVSGYFKEVPLAILLDNLARRVGAEVQLRGKVYYLGDLGADDLASVVIPLPSGGVEEAKEVLGMLKSERSRVAVWGSSIMLRDNLDTVRKFVDMIEQHRKISSRRYFLEVYFVSVTLEKLLEMSAEAQHRGINLVSGENQGKLFNVFLNSRKRKGLGEIKSLPMLQCTEGQLSEMNDTRDIPIEEKAVTDSGTVETTGYEIIKAGLIIGATVRRVGADQLNVAFNLELSSFENGETDFPVKNGRSIKSNLIVGDGEVCLVAGLMDSVKSTQKTLDFSANLKDLLGVRGGSSSDLRQVSTLVWLRVRELDRSGVSALVGLKAGEM
jgi:type II secretory pathway component GspD/PulD (secretin)